MVSTVVKNEDHDRPIHACLLLPSPERSTTWMLHKSSGLLEEIIIIKEQQTLVTQDCMHQGGLFQVRSLMIAYV